MAAKRDKTQPTMYHLALGRNVDRRTRVRAWKFVLAWEVAAGAVGLAAFYLAPEWLFDETWELILFGAAVVVIIGGLAYSQRDR